MRAKRIAVVSQAVGSVIEALEDRRLLSAVLTLENLDGLPFNDRLIFNRIQNPDTKVPNVVHDTSTLRLSNTGDQSLTLSRLAINGNWDFNGAPSNSFDGTVINPGQSLDVTLRFTQSTLPPHSLNETNYTDNVNGGASILGSLTISSDDPANSNKVVTLAGYWQSKSEHNAEPNLTTIATLLAGYGTSISDVYTPDLTQPLGSRTIYGDEIVSDGGWAAADVSQPVTVRQLADFHTQGNIVRTYWYAVDTQISHRILTSLASEGQTLLPHVNAAGDPLQASFSPNTTFGLRVDNEYSDDQINKANGSTSGGGHHIRFYPLRDRQGNFVANTWIVAMDYAVLQSQNYDFQDNVYIVSNMRPVNRPPAPTNLAATEGADITLNWTGVNYPTTGGYNVYRGTSANGPFTKLNSSPVVGTNFVDTAVPGGTSLYYQIKTIDSNSQAESIPVSIVAAAPGGPVANDDAFNANSGQAIQVNILANDTDSTGTILPGSVLATNPAHGSLSVNSSTGLVTYTATAGFTGTDSFTYTVDDNHGATSNAATVTFTVVNPTSAAPIGVNDSAHTLFNNAVTIDVLSNDTFSSPLDPSSIVVSGANQPSHGSITIDSSTGLITYTPAANFVGSDLFRYLVSDSLGRQTSSTATVNLNVGVRIGSGSSVNRSVTYTETGTTATIVLTKGVADVLFSGSGTVSVSSSRKATVTGSNLKVADIIASNTTTSSTLSITSKDNKGAITVNGISADGAMARIFAPIANFSGDLSVGGLASLMLKQISNSQINIGATGGKRLTLVTGNVADSVLTAANPISSLRTASWINSLNANMAISTPSIASLSVTGNFDASLNLSGTGTAAATLGLAKIGGHLAIGFWSIAGNARSINVGSVLNGWGASVAATLSSFVVKAGGLPADLSAGTMGALSITGNLTGNISAASARSIVVTGAINGSTIDLTGPVTGAVSLSRLAVVGAIDSSTIHAAKDIAAISAASMDGTSVTAGTSATLGSASTGNIGAAAIRSLRLTGKTGTPFSNTNIIAHTIKSALLGAVKTDNDGTPNGLAGATINSVVATIDGTVVKLGAKQLVDQATLSDYLASKGINFGDLEIEMLA